MTNTKHKASDSNKKKNGKLSTGCSYFWVIRQMQW